MTQKKSKILINENPNNHNVVKRRSGGKIAIIRLLFKYYYKSFYGPFFNFIFPVILYLVLSAFMQSSLVIPGMISMTTMSLGITGLPYSILELKNSVILKRIGAAPVKIRDFTITVICFFVIQLVLSILSLMLFTLIRHWDFNIFKGLWNVSSVFGFIYGNFLNAVLSISIGFSIASISKTPNQANAISALIYFPASFLSGQFIAIDIIATKPIMNYISLALPFRYTTMIITVSFAGSDVFTGNPFLYNDIVMKNIGSLDFVIKTLIDNNILTQQEIKTMTIQDIITKAIESNIIDSIISDFLFLIKKPKLIYQNWEPMVAYAYPYLLTTLSLIISVRYFSWSGKR